MEFFDSLQLSAISRQRWRLFSKEADEGNRLIAESRLLTAAKAHYYHAVGLTEKDDIVGACEHYLTALEIMEFETENLITSKFESILANGKRLKSQSRKVARSQSDCLSDSATQILCDRETLRPCDLNKEDYEKIRFLALTYTRLGRLFYNESYCDLAILKYKKALNCLNIIKDTISISYTYKNIGNVYQLLGEAGSALFHYRKSLEINPNLTNKLDLEKNIAQILFDKGEKDSAYVMIKRNLEKLDDYRQIDSYYGILGIFYHEDEEYDSAIYYLEKCHESTNVYIKNSVSVRLSAIYDSLGNLEKKAYYDKIVSELLTEQTNKGIEHNRIQSVYDDYNERKHEKTNLANKKRNTTLLIFTFTAICIAILSIWYIHKKNKIFSDKIRINEDYCKKKLKSIEEDTSKIIKQKDEEIRKSKKEISKMRRTKIEQKSVVNLKAYYDSDICKKNLEKNNTYPSSLKENELALLLKSADEHLNNISGRLMENFPSLNKNDIYTICLIILNVEKSKLPYLLDRDRKTIWDRFNKIKKLMGLEAKNDLFIHIKEHFLD